MVIIKSFNLRFRHFLLFWTRMTRIQQIYTDSLENINYWYYCNCIFSPIEGGIKGGCFFLLFWTRIYRIKGLNRMGGDYIMNCPPPAEVVPKEPEVELEISDWMTTHRDATYYVLNINNINNIRRDAQFGCSTIMLIQKSSLICGSDNFFKISTPTIFFNAIHH